MNILGISAYYHDSAAALLRDGEIVAAAQEERFTRKKHDSRFPGNAIKYCLSEASIGLTDVNHVVFYDKPLDPDIFKRPFSQDATVRYTIQRHSAGKA